MGFVASSARSPRLSSCRNTISSPADEKFDALKELEQGCARNPSYIGQEPGRTDQPLWWRDTVTLARVRVREKIVV
eukprot:3079289-Rhodomonas_salina.1